MLELGPTPAVGFQGGIDRSSTTAAMSARSFRACSYVSSTKGPIWSRRWQP